MHGKHRGKVGLPTSYPVPENTRLTVHPCREGHHIAGHGLRLRVFVDALQNGGGFSFLRHCTVRLRPHVVDLVLLERGEAEASARIFASMISDRLIFLTE